MIRIPFRRVVLFARRASSQARPSAKWQVLDAAGLLGTVSVIGGLVGAWFIFKSQEPPLRTPEDWSAYRPQGLLTQEEALRFVISFGPRLSPERCSEVVGLWREVTRDPAVLADLISRFSESEAKGYLRVRQLVGEGEELFRVYVRDRPFDDRALKALSDRPFSEGLTLAEFSQLVPDQARAQLWQKNAIFSAHDDRVTFKTVALHTAACKHFKGPL